MPSAHQSRRDVLLIAAGAFVAVGAGFATWPLISQMAPNRGSKRDTLDVDLERLAIGQTRQVPWMGLPILVLHRTQAQISEARETSLLSLPDPFARAKGADGKLDASDANRIKAGHAQWLVVVARCTKEHCIIKVSDVAPSEAFICPCCASRYDASGRVRSGPASFNLEVPPYAFVSSTQIRLGVGPGP